MLLTSRFGAVSSVSGRVACARLQLAFKKPVARPCPSAGRVALLAVQAAASTASTESEQLQPAVEMVAVSDADAKRRLDDLRRLMAAADGGKGVHAYIVPSEDAHMSEYAPLCDMRREFISRFTGSAGTAVVTTDAAMLWTDGRYFLQAEQELSSDWQLMRKFTKDCPSVEDWLAKNLPEGGRVGIDAFLHTINDARALKKALEAAGKELVAAVGDGNLVDAIWSDRPKPPQQPLRVHALQHAGEDVPTKIQRMRDAMQKEAADVLLVSALDEVAWLLNLRGNDVEYNPVFTSYVVLTADAATLYVDQAKIGADVAQHLQDAGVTVQPYDKMLDEIRRHAGECRSLWLDPAKVSYAVHQTAMHAADAANSNGSKGTKRAADGKEISLSGLKIVEAPSPVAAAKAIKNDVELAGMREAHLRDAVAIAQFLCWFDQQMAAGATLTEVDVDIELTKRRAAQPGFNELSFPTIAGAGSNGAIIHYRAQRDTCRDVPRDGMLLIDSGAQYDCGTTDVTRTLHTGTPSSHERGCFTRVLQGHIALDQSIWPQGTPGFVLDAMARKALWSVGLDYRHGTGHGVGAALNVHEGPQSISARYHIMQALQAGMICSNEPGYYEDGAFGIRIENLLNIKAADTPFNFGDVGFLRFERLTMVPLQKKLIDVSLLSAAELKWVNDYHQQVWESVSPRLDGDEVTKAWLREQTQPITA